MELHSRQLDIGDLGGLDGDAEGSRQGADGAAGVGEEVGGGGAPGPGVAARRRRARPHDVPIVVAGAAVGGNAVEPHEEVVPLVVLGEIDNVRRVAQRQLLGEPLALQPQVPVDGRRAVCLQRVRLVA